MPKVKDWGARALGLCITAGAIYSWTDFLWPPVSLFRHTVNPSPVAVLLELLKPENSIYKVPLAGYLFLLVTASLLVFCIYLFRNVTNYLEFSLRKISIIDSKFEVTFKDDQLQRSTLRRVQSFHANRSGISAYRTTSSLDSPVATMDLKTLSADSCIGGKSITDELIRRSTRNNLELIEIYDQDLPTNVFLTFIPNILVRALFLNGMFRNYVVTRTLSVDYLDEYSAETAHMQVTANEFPATNVTLSVDFPASSGPEPAQMSCFLITEGAVQRLDPTHHRANDRLTYEIDVRSLHHASVRLQWTNERLATFKAA